MITKVELHRKKLERFRFPKKLKVSCFKGDNKISFGNVPLNEDLTNNIDKTDNLIVIFQNLYFPF